jgi:thymidylate kinase
VITPHTPLIILEGTCGAGKSTLLGALPAHLMGLETRCMTQRETYAPVVPAEDSGTLDASLHAQLLGVITAHVAREAAEPSRWVVVDTLHPTHFVRTGTLTLASFLEADRQLHALGAVTVMLRVSAACIRARTVIGRRGTGFHRYAQKFGADDDSLTDYFVAEQERMLNLLQEHSRLPLVVLDGEQPTAELVSEIERMARAAASV